MKKAIITVMLACTIMAGHAQVQKVLLEVVKDSVALVADTTSAFGPYSWDYKWIMQVETFALDQNDASVRIQVSNDTTYWINYADNSTLTLTDTMGMHAFEDDRLIWSYFRVITGVGTVASGEYRVKLYGVRNR